ncbi:MAG: hypothetical protein H6709_04880 [Kofleriaceae bacterium]|nr:hypothetical protein [Kofleriaceae bacterium]
MDLEGGRDRGDRRDRRLRRPPRRSPARPRRARRATRGAPATPPPPRDAAPAAPPDAAPPDAAPPDAAPPIAIPEGHPVPTGERFTLVEGGRHRSRAGVTVAWPTQGHKHAAGGATTAIYGLELRRGGKHAEIELRSDDDVLEAEVDALGTLLWISGTYDQLTIVVAARKTPRPLDEDVAVEQLQAAAAAAALPEGDQAWSIEQGVVALTTRAGDRVLWQGRCGLYTRRIWFLPP